MKRDLLLPPAHYLQQLPILLGVLFAVWEKVGKKHVKTKLQGTGCVCCDPGQRKNRGKFKGHQD